MSNTLMHFGLRILSWGEASAKHFWKLIHISQVTALRRNPEQTLAQPELPECRVLPPNGQKKILPWYEVERRVYAHLGILR